MNKEDEMSLKNDQEVLNLQQELYHIKTTINQMNDKIKFLDKAIENIIKINIDEIVVVVASSLEGKKKRKIKVYRLLNSLLTVINVVSI